MRKWKIIIIMTIWTFLGGFLNVYADNNNILGAYVFNNGNCKSGEEDTCQPTTCYEDSVCDPGTIIKYQVSEQEVKYFYVLRDDGDTMTLQQRENTVSGIAWYETPLNPDNTKGPETALSALTDATEQWDYVNLQNGKKARMITVAEANAIGCNQTICPEWMYTNLESSSHGYWTSDSSDEDALTAWAIIEKGMSRANANTTYNGVRAVVVVNRTRPQNNEPTTEEQNQNTTVQVGDTNKNITMIGYLMGVCLLIIGCYVIYKEVKRKDVE